MTNFLLRHFVKDYENTKDNAVRERYGYLSSAVGLVCNLLLFVVKLIMGTLTGSIAITADAFNNLSDMGSCTVTFVGFRMASRPADEDHPFGHGRIEYISGLIISFFIMLVGVEIVKSSIDKIFAPEPVEFSFVALAALLVSIGVKLWMGRFNGVLGRRIDSAAMRASATDSISDCVSTGATALGLVLSLWLPFSIDGYLGVAVGCFVLYSGFGIAKDTVGQLLGGRPDPELVRAATDILMSYDIVQGVHDLIIHSYGPGRAMGSAHVEIPENYNLLKAHDIIDNAEKEIQSKLHMPFTIHLDPVATDSPEVNSMRLEVERIVAEVSPKLSIHDFRMVVGDTHTNLIFDVLVPFDCTEKNVTLKKRIDEKVSQLGEHYFTVITFDRSYT